MRFNLDLDAVGKVEPDFYVGRGKLYVRSLDTAGKIVRKFIGVEPYVCAVSLRD